MKANTNKERSFYTQGQRCAARVLCICWLLASGSPEGALATPKRQPALVPTTTTSSGDPSLASTPSTPTPGGILQLPPGAPGSFWGDSAGSSPSIDAALQERMSQEGAPFREGELLRTSPKASPVSENWSFQAREGESVRFACQQGQWCAEVSSYIGAASRRAVLPVVCSQGEDVASNLEVLSKYPSWYTQRQIHVLDRNVCPTLGEVVYVGELGLRGGGQGQSSSRRGKTRSNPKQQGDGKIDLPQSSGFSQKQVPSSSQTASLAGHPATTTAASRSATYSAKGKEPYRPHSTTSASDQGLAGIGQLAEGTECTPSELDQIEEVNRLKEQIDELYPQLSKATPADYANIVDKLILHLVCLLERESRIGVQDNDSAQDYIARVWVIHVTKQVGVAYGPVDKKLKALLERAYGQALKAANPNLKRIKVLDDILEAAKVLEELAVSDQNQSNTTKPYPNTPRRLTSPPRRLTSPPRRLSSPPRQPFSSPSRLLWLAMKGGPLGGAKLLFENY